MTKIHGISGARTNEFTVEQGIEKRPDEECGFVCSAPTAMAVADEACHARARGVVLDDVHHLPMATASTLFPNLEPWKRRDRPTIAVHSRNEAALATFGARDRDSPTAAVKSCCCQSALGT